MYEPSQVLMRMNSKFTYVGIRVTDLQKSIDFYTKILGMKAAGRGKIEQTKGETVGLQSEKDSFVLELNYCEDSSPYYTKYNVGDGLDHLAFKVDDLTKPWKKLERRDIELF